MGFASFSTRLDSSVTKHRGKEIKYLCGKFAFSPFLFWVTGCLCVELRPTLRICAIHSVEIEF